MKKLKKYRRVTYVIIYMTAQDITAQLLANLRTALSMNLMAAAGCTTLMLLLLVAWGVCSAKNTGRYRRYVTASTAFTTEDFQDHLVLLYKGTFLAYAGGVR